MFLFDWSSFDPDLFDGVSEQLVGEVLPPTGFIRNYTAYAFPLTEANGLFHVPVALCQLAAIAPRLLHFPRGEDLVSANLYAVLVGPSALARKSHAIKMGLGPNGVLGSAVPERVIPDTGSPEYFTDFMIDNKQRVLVYEEGGRFLASSVREGSYLHRLRKDLTEMWGGTPLTRPTISKRNQRAAEKRAQKQAAKESGTAAALAEEPAGSLTNVIPFPAAAYPPELPAALNPEIVETDVRLSICMGTTVPDWEAYSLLHEWESGFASRFFFLRAKPIRKLADPESNPPVKAELIRWLKRLFAYCKPRASTCRGFSPEACKLWHEWQASLPIKRFGERAAAAVDRAQNHALKIALLYAWDRITYLVLSSPSADANASHTAARLADPFDIEPADLQPAVKLAEVHIASVLSLLRRISENEDGRWMRRILKLLRDEGGSMPDPAFFKALDLTFRRAWPLLETLIRRKEINMNGRCVALAGVPLLEPGAELLEGSTHGSRPERGWRN